LRFVGGRLSAFLTHDKQIEVIAALAEGLGIRATARLTVPAAFFLAALVAIGAEVVKLEDI
jgi:hypothetical protein